MRTGHDEQYRTIAAIRRRESQLGSHPRRYKLDAIWSSDDISMSTVGDADMDNAQSGMGRLHDATHSSQSFGDPSLTLGY